MLQNLTCMSSLPARAWDLVLTVSRALMLFSTMLCANCGGRTQTVGSAAHTHQTQQVMHVRVPGWGNLLFRNWQHCLRACQVGVSISPRFHIWGTSRRRMLGNRFAAASLNRVDLLTAFSDANVCIDRFKAQLRMCASNKSL
jgi:hypothetical protein